MKKVLLATTALFATAGFASADIALSGAAGAGIYNGPAGANNPTDAYAYTQLTATMTGETDGGLEFGASLTARGGDKVDFGDDEYDDDFSSPISIGDIFISGDFGTITINPDDIDNLVNDDFSHDISYEYSTGGVTATLTFDVNPEGDGDHYSFGLAYSMDALSASFAIDDRSEFDITLGYDITSEISAALKYTSEGSLTELELDYDNGMFMAGIDYFSTGDYDLSVGYSADGVSVSADINEAHEWTIRGEYDFGGGLTANAYYNSDETFALGAVMSF